MWKGRFLAVITTFGFGMRVSVIIPVYNAAPFLRRAVQSALDQPEVVEVLLIDDASTDDSLQIAQALAQTHSKVIVLQHPDQQNHGPGASRNLGLQKATMEYVTFLDADDWYLSGRFTHTKHCFLDQPDAEGIYEAIENTAPTETEPLLIMMHTVVPPPKLFSAFLHDDIGFFSIVGTTFKRSSLLTKVGLFDPDFFTAEDTDFLIRCMNALQLYPGHLTKPVVSRTIHERNISFNTDGFQDRKRLYQKLFDQIPHFDWPRRTNLFILRLHLDHQVRSAYNEPARKDKKALLLIQLLCSHPKRISKSLF